MALAELEPLLLHAPAPTADPSLSALGMSAAIAQPLAAVVARRAGLVLVAGPGRSGVSTTLQVLERLVRAGGRGVLVADGPSLDSAIAARDPDAILVDSLEGANAASAAQAALDGRLVLAGMEGASAVATVARLRALGVERYQAAAALGAVAAQRLVRRLCRTCRVPVQASGSVSALLGFDSGTIVFLPGGCDACGGSGFVGETGVFEAVFPDAALRRLIATGGDEAILARHAFLNAPNLGAAARAMVREGLTTPEEAVRVSRS